jgi:hypothetical protein
VSDDVRDAEEEEALRWAAGRLATERRFERWRWNVSEMPPVDELYARSSCRSARLEGETR